MPQVREFEILFQQILSYVDDIDGWMTIRELELLALLAAFPTADGLILEIGSYRGRSTVAIALASERAGDPYVVAVDPLPDSGPMAEDEAGKPSARALFENNLTRAGVLDRMEFHQQLSGDLGRSWDRPLRFLWIDGDHTYSGAKIDFDVYAPHLSDGAIVAFHDVLAPFDGPVRVFAEDVLLSPHFGPSGFVGSIGWAQYFKDPQLAEPYRGRNVRLYKRVSRLIPYVAFDKHLSWLQRRFWRLARSRVPHRRMLPQRWIQSMAQRAAPQITASVDFQPVVIRTTA